jgi:hypothetical protein
VALAPREQRDARPRPEVVHVPAHAEALGQRFERLREIRARRVDIELDALEEESRGRIGVLVGFDDVAASSLYTPPLTTVRQPMEAMGAMGANLVVEGINAVLEKREVSAVHRKMAPELAVRESTRNL